MIQRGHGARLLLEPPQPFGIARERFGEHLDGYVALQARVPRPVHFAHAPGAQRRQDLVGTQNCAGVEGHSSVRIIPATAAVRGESNSARADRGSIIGDANIGEKLSCHPH